ncbi:kelch-like protein 34 [Alligator mississippiensis]|nr:kelch-like protein 34 [Alligator mississippiensis]
MSYFLSYCKSHCSTVLSHYQTLRSEGLMCDILLKVKENEFPAHKSLLACSSDYFRAMFKSYTTESKASVIHLQVISSVGLQHILDFIYTSWLPLSFESLEDTLEAASYLQVTEAIGLCNHYIVNNLTLENCCFSANVATKFYLPDALAATEKYIISNLWRLLDLDFIGLLELNFRSLMAVVESDVPMVNESCLLNLVMMWLKHDKSRLTLRSSLLEQIRYGLIPVEDLRKVYTQSEVPLPASVKCLIIKAINYHSFVFKQPLLQDKSTTLRNQKTQIILLGGGTANEGLVSDVVAFDVYNHKWRTLTQVQDRLQHHNMCVIGNFLYVLGGEIESSQSETKTDPSLSVTSGVHRYDPRFNKWTQITGMLEKRCQFSCCVLGNNIFAIGGRGENGSLHSSVEVYNITRDKWTKVVELPCKVHGHASTVCKNTIYLSGGKSMEQTNTSKDVYSLSTVEGQWMKQAPMSIARFGHQMATIRDAIFTFLGLYEPFSEIERYDPSENQWTRLRPLVYDRFCYGLAVVEETALLIGGKKWQDSQEVPTQDVVGYDIDNDCWEEICKLPLPWYGLQCAVLQLSESAATKGDTKQQRSQTAELTLH